MKIVLIVLSIVFFPLSLLVAFWVLPGIVAKMRKHPNTAAIFVLSIFLGVTVIGWIVALVWAFTNPTPQAQR